MLGKDPITEVKIPQYQQQREIARFLLLPPWTQLP